MVMLIRFLHMLNAQSPIPLISPHTVTEARLSQFENAESGMLVPPLMTIFFRFVFGIYCIKWVGMVASVILLQFLKAESPTFITLSGIVIFLRFEHPSKARRSILVPPFINTVCKFSFGIAESA